MARLIAIQTDPIENFAIGGDSTFALGLEAQKRGHAMFAYTADALGMELSRDCAPRDSVMAKGRHIKKLTDEQGAHVAYGDSETLKLADCDVVLMRQDPPFDMQYITATHLLEHVHPATLVVNNPAEVRNAPEKLLVTYFPELLPPSLITRDGAEIKAFRRQHGEIIIKPLFGNGGAGIFHLKENDDNLSSLLETMLEADRAPLMVQQYLPAVRGGDKRVILVDGVAVAALNRVPQQGESRSNMHVGGRAEAAVLDDDDMRIGDAIGPELKKRDLLFAGIDVIGGKLTEINVTSPTGIREIKKFSNIDVAELIWDAIEARL